MKKVPWTENLEKYLFAFLTVAMSVQLSVMAWLAVDLDTQPATVIMGGFVIFCVTALVVTFFRKFSKYSNLTRLRIGPDGFEFDAEAKEVPQNDEAS